MKLEFDKALFLICFLIISFLGFVGGILLKPIMGIEVSRMFGVFGLSLGATCGLFSAIKIKDANYTKDEEVGK